MLACFGWAAVASASLLFILARILPASFLVAPVTSRSNHAGPARQIGGLAVVPAALGGIAAGLLTGYGDADILLAAGAAGAGLMALGLADDRWDMPSLPKLACHFIICLSFAAALGPAFRLWPDMLPVAAERILVALFLTWFVNLTNFMDGLDLMVVSGIGLPHALLAAFGLLALTDGSAALISAAVAGALLGFMPFNFPPARIFLGDSGSLPLGFLTGVAVLLVMREHPVAALLPFLFFVADTTSVLLLRLARGENLLEAHSTHAYQIARRGRSVQWIVLRVALSGVWSTGMAAVAISSTSPAVKALAVLSAGAVLAVIIMRMRRSARPQRSGPW